jgi:methionine-gamma-lyase
MSEGRTEQQRGFHTRAAKTYADRGEGRPLSIPILQATNFEIGSSETLGEMFHRRDERVYARLGQPTGAAAGEKIASLEGAEAALVFSSGMAAITTSLLTLLRSGDHVVAQRAA